MQQVIKQLEGQGLQCKLSGVGPERYATISAHFEVLAKQVCLQWAGRGLNTVEPHQYINGTHYNNDQLNEPQNLTNSMNIVINHESRYLMHVAHSKITIFISIELTSVLAVYRGGTKARGGKNAI